MNRDEILKAIRHYESAKKRRIRYAELAIEALKRCLPMKPVDIYTETMLCPGQGNDELALYGECPSCGFEVQGGMKACFECGQSLDWGDT